MNLKAWLDAERGRAAELASRLHVTRSRISQMTDDGVPPKYMLAVRDFTRGAVSLEEMVIARMPDSKKAHAKEKKATKARRAKAKARAH
jgi:hypothetical protein